ncbi:ABC transporter permease [Rhodobaculum claviforme]|uniref:Iron ABC transporter permease n=1 Tax=Rhodobaculum claviforme TaxID=1549854 RepID=A0A934TJ56_9RHOB|nr:iron ABC transporter permease [Rhodobaculum claviforme]MBK5926604.1 iron ABC transporter permease [Rhodobaculum claviforme]
MTRNQGPVRPIPIPRTPPPRRPRPTAWTALALVVAAVVALPIVTVVGRVFVPSEGVWPHLVATVLPLYLSNTLTLVAGVSTLAVVIGVTTGWLVAAYEFPGRRVFEWALMLPLAMPAYVIAYVYFDRLSFWGPVQTGLRQAFGWGRGDYWFPQVASLPGAVVLLALVLYPYVYLLARAAFLGQSQHLMEAARALGHSRASAFRRVALPMAWPAIAAGAAFVAMETLADYGAVVHLGVQTLTTGIFRTWFARGAPVAAAQLSALLVLFVLTAFLLERVIRGNRRFAGDAGGRAAALVRVRLGPGTAALAAGACALPVALGFVFPAAELVRLAIIAGDPMWGPRFVVLATNSLKMAAGAAALLVGIAVFLGHARRLQGGPAIGAAMQAASLGYAMPGAVIAVGVLIPLAAFDNALDALMRARFGVSTGLVLTGTIAALMFAYVVRYLAVALKTVEAALARIPRSMDEAARTLGTGPAGLLVRVHVPLLRRGMLTAAIFVFADVMKELPATLIVRPFNFDTLAIRTYRLASDGRLEEAATAALMIVAVGILPVILLSRALNR